MISLPRSPVVKLLIALLIALALIAYSIPSKALPSDKEWTVAQKAKVQVELGQALPRQKKPSAKETPPKETAAKEPSPLSTFEVPKDLYLTHDVAIPQDIPAWSKADTEMLGTTIGYTLKLQMLKPEYSRHDDLTGRPDRLDFAELGRAERLYKSLWNYVYPIYEALPGRDREKERALSQLAKTRPEVDFFVKLEKRLYPWVHHVRRSSFSLYKTYKGRGIVYCAGDNQFEFVVTSIQSLRSRLKSTLPIQIFYMGDSDLSRARQEYLRDMGKDIETIDVTLVLNDDYMQLGGWSIKPFAMLASSFEEVMFIDADAYFLQDPAVLFNDPGYLATGALFFYDRTLFPEWIQGSVWLKSILPIMSSFPPTTRMFRLNSAHEQESGVVLINKKMRFLGMLAVCKLNGKWERDLVTYQVFHGDKETFWTGFEMVQEPYAFMRNYGGVIGELRPDNHESVCGAQLHEDYLGQPLWWNGGLYRNKNEGITRYLDFDYWMTGGGHQEHRERYTRDKEEMIELLTDLSLASSEELELEPKDAEWDFKESCLVGAEVQKLTERQKSLASGYVSIDMVARKDSELLNEGRFARPQRHNWETV